MDRLLPCPHCGGFDTLTVSGIQIGTKTTWRTICDAEDSGCGAQGGTALTKHAAAAAWNRRAPADLALARLAAKLFDRAWIKSVGFVNEGGLQDDLDRDTVAFGLVRYEAPGDFQMAPGIASAIARLLAPDGAESEVTDG